MALRLEIDYDKCIASGVCAQIAPGVFAVDDEGMIVVLDTSPGDELREVVEEAAAACPACVITVADEP